MHNTPSHFREERRVNGHTRCLCANGQFGGNMVTASNEKASPAPLTAKVTKSLLAGCGGAAAAGTPQLASGRASEGVLSAAILCKEVSITMLTELVDIRTHLHIWRASANGIQSVPSVNFTCKGHFRVPCKGFSCKNLQILTPQIGLSHSHALRANARKWWLLSTWALAGSLRSTAQLTLCWLLASQAARSYKYTPQ